MKRILILPLVLILSINLSAQKRYDEIKYPPLNDFKKAAVEEFNLDNGITFYLVEDNELPLIRINAIVRTGSLLEPADKTGLASMAGSIIREGGSVNYPSDKLNILLEDKAASISTYIGQGSGGANMSLLKEDFDDLLPVFVDVIQNPLFPEDKIELAKTQTKSSISRRNDDQQSIAGREFNKLIYGQDSPYTRQIEYATIDAISRDDLVNFHKEAFTGSNMIIGVIGDFDTKDMKKKLRRAFGSLPEGGRTNIVYPEVTYDFPTTVNLIDKPDVNQSYVILGHIGGLRENPDYAALQMMNQILSGGFSGRLLQTVRSDLGLAYAVGGGYSSNINYPGVFSITVMTKSSTTGQAIDAIQNELVKLQEEPVSSEELNDARDRFLNSLVFRYDSKAKILNEQLSNDYNGLSQDAFDEYVADLRKVSIADIQRVAQEYMAPDKVQILVVGNKSEIGDQLNKYGSVNELDITIPTPSSDEPSIGGDAEEGNRLLSLMAEAIIEPGIELNTITTVSVQTQNTPMGDMDINNTSTINYSNLTMESTLDTPQGKMGMSLANGKATMSMMGQEQALPPAMASVLTKELKYSYINIALNKSSMTAEYLGTESIDNIDYVALKIITDGKITYLINPETHLPYKKISSEFNPQMGKEVVSETIYSNWKTTDGVAYAYEHVTITDGQKNSSSIIQSVKVK